MSKEPVRVSDAFRRPILVGQVWRDAVGDFRIMATAEKYAMARRKGAAPFVRAFNQIWEFSTLVDTNKVKP